MNCFKQFPSIQWISRLNSFEVFCKYHITKYRVRLSRCFVSHANRWKLLSYQFMFFFLCSLTCSSHFFIVITNLDKMLVVQRSIQRRKIIDKNFDKNCYWTLKTLSIVRSECSDYDGEYLVQYVVCINQTALNAFLCCNRSVFFYCCSAWLWHATKVWLLDRSASGQTMAYGHKQTYNNW